METNLMIIVLVIVASITIIFFFVKRNLEDKNELIRELIKDDEESIQEVHDVEINPTE